tara:strand:- start:2542 stop:3354 length:813 start_codon:yes stop_codon:yes gene_type:complete
MKQIVNSNVTHDWPNVVVDYHKKIELFIDTPMGYDGNKDTFKIFWVKEAEEIIPMKKWVIENHKNFDIILTYENDVLDNCDNSHFMPFGSTWIMDYDFGYKRFCVSNLVGNKNITVGHMLRSIIHTNQNDIRIPKDFYVSRFGGPNIMSGNKILGQTKNPLFNSQFHICIENSKQSNLFTEKLIDCLITKTVPIFYGCDNISDFFNVKGFFIVNNLEDVLGVCNSLTETTYSEMVTHIEDNYNTSLKYADLSDNFRIRINEILNHKNGSI